MVFNYHGKRGVVHILDASAHPIFLRHGLSIPVAIIMALGGFGTPLLACGQSILPILSPCVIGGHTYRNVAIARDRGVSESSYIAQRHRRIEGKNASVELHRELRLIREIYSHPDMTPDDVSAAYGAACEGLIKAGVDRPSPTTLLGE